MSSPVLSTGFSDIQVSGPSGDVGDDLSGFPAADNIATSTFIFCCVFHLYVKDSNSVDSEAAELQIDMLPAVHSFLPIIERLPGLILDHNLYVSLFCIVRGFVLTHAIATFSILINPS
jgi:hypothetical protein